MRLRHGAVAGRVKKNASRVLLRPAGMMEHEAAVPTPLFSRRPRGTGHSDLLGREGRA
jgi:hypothetical protein